MQRLTLRALACGAATASFLVLTACAADAGTSLSASDDPTCFVGAQWKIVPTKIALLGSNAGSTRFDPENGTLPDLALELDVLDRYDGASGKVLGSAAPYRSAHSVDADAISLGGEAGVVATMFDSPIGPAFAVRQTLLDVDVGEIAGATQDQILGSTIQAAGCDLERMDQLAGSAAQDSDAFQLAAGIVFDDGDRDLQLDDGTRGTEIEYTMTFVGGTPSTTTP